MVRIIKSPEDQSEDFEMRSQLGFGSREVT